MTRQASSEGGWETAGRPPHPALRPFLRRGYVGYHELRPPPRRREVAYDAIVMVINLGSPIGVDAWGPGGSFVAGLHDRASVTAHGPGQLGIQVDLEPVGAALLLGVPMGELARQIVALEELVPAELIERLRDAADWETRFAVLDGFLLGRLRDAAAPPRPDVAFAWSRLHQSHGAIGIAALCAELGCSRRHLAGRFAHDVGLSPKAVARVLRFRRVIELLHAGGTIGPARLGDVAAAAGYYDQPHLNREFRELAGVTPGAYLAARLPGLGGVSA